MKTAIEWLEQKSLEFSDNTFLIDSQRSVSYAENLNRIQKLMGRLHNNIPCEQPVIYLGPGSIESYQLYFAVISLQAVWVPVSYRLESDIILDIIGKLKPAFIIYDNLAESLIKNLSNITIPCLTVTEIFHALDFMPGLTRLDNGSVDRIISIYLTSGSTGAYKMVMHDLSATLEHARSTVSRYGFNEQSRLFNPRQLFHVSGAFALTTLMHCGGSIVIPDFRSQELCPLAWARLIFDTKATHVSFLPSEMRAYADLIDKNKELNPPKLQRITTGGEPVELTDLIQVASVFATNRTCYQYLWMFYPYLGDGIVFHCCKTLYELLYGSLVQVTQTYGATELICNAVANSPRSGPDTRGIGSALDSLRPEVIDERGLKLPWDGKSIGKLQFFGSSIARGYWGCTNTSLAPGFYDTGDLAALGSRGDIVFYGRSEHLITLNGKPDKINPVVLERALQKIHGIEGAIIFKYNDALHAAIKMSDDAHQIPCISAVKQNATFSLITTLSFWDVFPLAAGGKIDKRAVVDSIQREEKLCIIIDAHENESPSNASWFGSCVVS